MITVLVVDDHELVRTGICRMLEDHADVEVIGQAESGEEAIAIVRQQHPQVVLLDVNMPGIGGVETTPSFITDGSRDESHCCKRPRRRALPIFIIKSRCKRLYH